MGRLNAAIEKAENELESRRVKRERERLEGELAALGSDAA
jgi:hypothetical protein